jgi:hypothetical protein
MTALLHFFIPAGVFGVGLANFIAKLTPCAEKEIL